MLRRRSIDSETPPVEPSRRLRFDPGPIGRIVLLAIAFRLLTLFMAFLANILFPMKQPEQFTVFRQSHALWDTVARYDSGWYHGIARSGYSFVEGGRSNLAFFPVYPLAMRHLGRALGGRREHYYFAGLSVSWAAFAGAMILVRRLARMDLPPADADRAALYAAIFPFAFFYGVVYSESLFLLFTLAAVYGFRTKRWWLGGIAGALASATRVNGILALPALGWIAWREARPDRRERWQALLALALVAAGIGSYSAYVYSLSGSPFAWAASITRWGYQPGGAPWDTLGGLLRALATRPMEYLITEAAAPYDLLNAGTALMFLAATPFVWIRLGTGYGLFMLANLWLPLSSGQFEGLGRYCAVIFPFFIWLATFRAEAVRASIVVIFAMLYMFCLALFTKLHPIF